jgi:pilus assembly protein CpaB
VTSSISIRTVVTLAVAIFLGLIAVVAVRGHLNSMAIPIPAPVADTSGVPVVVAAQPMTRGTAVQPAFLKVINFPAGNAPAGVFHSISELTAGGQRLASRSMVINEPLLIDSVTPPGGKLNLADIVSEGMRAISIRTNDVIGVAGFIIPGDRIDVLLTRQTGTSNDPNNNITQVLADNVRVLGVDQSSNDESDKPVVSKTVTVEVTPKQAQGISLGSQLGSVSLTLRPVADVTPLQIRSTSVSDLERSPPVRRSGNDEPRIRIWRGTAASNVSFGGAAGIAPTQPK